MSASHSPLINYEGYRDRSDGLHPHASEDGSRVPFTNFDFSVLDPQPETGDTVPIDQATGAFSEILAWALASDSLEHAAAKIAALSVLLDPTGKFRSLGAVAREANCSRALLSKALLELRDRFKLGQNFRGNLLRDHCRQAQRDLLAAGRHSSQTRKNRSTTTT